MNPELLFAEAAKRLEQNRFREASALFRQAATVREPTRNQLANLSVAEDEDRVQARREICSRYRSSLTCKLSLVQALESAGHPGLAVQQASEALEANGLSQNEELLVRLVRLKSALATTSCHLMLEDFAYVWQAGEENAVVFRFRKEVLSPDYSPRR